MNYEILNSYVPDNRVYDIINNYVDEVSMKIKN